MGRFKCSHCVEGRCGRLAERPVECMADFTFVAVRNPDRECGAGLDDARRRTERLVRGLPQSDGRVRMQGMNPFSVPRVQWDWRPEFHSF